MAHLGPTSTTLKEIMATSPINYGPYVDDNSASNTDMLLKINQAGIDFLRNKWIGTIVSAQDPVDTGNVGREIEQLVLGDFHPDCHNIGSSSGPDLLIYCLDIKTHKEVSASGAVNDCSWTISGMNPARIISTKYEDSPIYKKLQGHLEIAYDDKEHIITKVDVCYYDHSIYQDLFKKAYEESRTVLKNQLAAETKIRNVPNVGHFFKTIYKSFTVIPIESKKYGQFEKMNGTMFNFRMPHSAKKIINRTSHSLVTTLYSFQ